MYEYEKSKETVESILKSPTKIVKKEKSLLRIQILHMRMESSLGLERYL